MPASSIRTGACDQRQLSAPRASTTLRRSVAPSQAGGRHGSAPASSLAGERRIALDVPGKPLQARTAQRRLTDVGGQRGLLRCPLHGAAVDFNG